MYKLSRPITAELSQWLEIGTSLKVQSKILGAMPSPLKKLGKVKIQKLAQNSVYWGNNFGASQDNLTELVLVMCCKAEMKIVMDFSGSAP